MSFKMQTQKKKKDVRQLMTPCSDSDDDLPKVPRKSKGKKVIKRSKPDTESDDDEDIASFSQKFAETSEKLASDDGLSDDDFDDDSETETADVARARRRMEMFDSDEEERDVNDEAKHHMSPSSDSESEGIESGQIPASSSDSEDETPVKKPTKLQSDLEKFRSDIKNIPFEDLQKLKQKIGLKAFNSLMSGNTAKSKPKTFKKAEKNQPVEMSSKQRVSKFREVVPVKKRKVRDPRFDDLCGTYNETLFKESYSFIDDIRQNEKKELQKQMKETEDEEKKEKIKYLLTRMSQQDLASSKKEKSLDIKRKVKEQEKALVQEGKLPFYLKKSERKKLELAEQYRELKKNGKLEKYLMKRRKKNAQQEKKKLPGKAPFK